MGSSRWTHASGSVYEIPDEDAPPLAMTRYAGVIQVEDFENHRVAVQIWRALGSRGPEPVYANRLGDIAPYLVERAS